MFVFVIAAVVVVQVSHDVQEEALPASSSSSSMRPLHDVVLSQASMRSRSGWYTTHGMLAAASSRIALVPRYVLRSTKV